MNQQDWGPPAGRQAYVHGADLYLEHPGCVAPAFADHKLAFQLQVLNALNEQNPIQIDPVSESGHYTVSNTYNQGLFFEDPRYVRLSVSYDY